MESIVSAKWLHENLNDPEMIILDATLHNQRSKQPKAIQKLQLLGARFFDIKQKFSDLSNEFPTAYPSIIKFEKEAQNLGINQSSKIVLYDANGIYSSARAYWLFKSMGHKNVAVLDGGLPEWIKNQFPTEALNLENTYHKGNFTVNHNGDSVRKFNNMFKNLETQAELVIDVRSADRYNCLVPEPREGLRMGTIPNSINIPYTNVLENGKFKSDSELDIIFKPLVKENRKLVFSCGSGITACVAMLAAQKVITNDLAVYDGSWTEWGALVTN